MCKACGSGRSFVRERGSGGRVSLLLVVSLSRVRQMANSDAAWRVLCCDWLDQAAAGKHARACCSRRGHSPSRLLPMHAATNLTSPGSTLPRLLHLRICSGVCCSALMLASALSDPVRSPHPIIDTLYTTHRHYCVIHGITQRCGYLSFHPPIRIRPRDMRTNLCAGDR